MIQRALKEVIGTSMQPNKVMLVFGARRVGKTVLIKQLIEQFKGQVLFLNGEDASTEEMFSTRTASHYRQLWFRVLLLSICATKRVSLWWGVPPLSVFPLCRWASCFRNSQRRNCCLIWTNTLFTAVIPNCFPFRISSVSKSIFRNWRSRIC